MRFRPRICNPAWGLPHSPSKPLKIFNRCARPTASPLKIFPGFASIPTLHPGRQQPPPREEPRERRRAGQIVPRLELGAVDEGLQQPQITRRRRDLLRPSRAAHGVVPALLLAWHRRIVAEAAIETVESSQEEQRQQLRIERVEPPSRDHVDVTLPQEPFRGIVYRDVVGNVVEPAGSDRDQVLTRIGILGPRLDQRSKLTSAGRGILQVGADLDELLLPTDATSKKVDLVAARGPDVGDLCTPPASRQSSDG